MTAATVDTTHKPTILIVDDIPNSLGVVMESLENTYRLVVALDGDEGLQRAAFIKPDLILLGVMIPGMDGFEVCRRLKQNPDTADIPVICLSALTGAEHKVTGFKAGGIDYLTKAMPVDEVIARIGAHLGMRLMRRQLQRQQVELEQQVAELNASNRLLREEIDKRERVLEFIAQRAWLAEGGVLTSAAAELERRRSEQQLEESRQFLSRIIETIPDPVFAKDRQHRWVLLNHAFCEFIGYPREDLLGKSDGDFFAKHEVEVFQAKDEIVFTSGEECVNEEEFTGRDGKTRTVVTKKNRYIDDRGHAYLIGIIQDITEHKAAEWRMSHVLSSLPGFIYSFRMAPDGHCSFPFASRGIEDIYGLTPDDVKDDMAPLHALTHPDDAPRVIAALAESAQMLAPFRTELRVLRPGRPELWVECRSLPERDSDGGITWHGLMLDITERKRAEMENRRLISILEESADFIGSADMQGNLLYHNPAARRMVGLPDEADMSRMHVTDMHPEWATKQVRETTLPAVLEHGVWRGDSALRHRDGREIPVAQLLILHRDAEGRPEFMSTIMQDLTEHKRIQNRLELIERAVDLSSDTILLIDEQLRFTYVNEAACRSLGYRREELLGMTPPDIDVDVTRDMAMAMLQATFKNGGLPVFESRQRARDGRIFPVEISASLVEYGGAQFSLAVVRDISQRKQAENLLRQRERELRTLVENLPTMVVRYDRNFQRVYVNRAYSLITGRSESEILGKSAEDVWRATNISAESYIAVLGGVMRNGRKSEVSLEWIDANGRLISHEMKIVPEFDTDGQVSSVLALGFDLSDRRHRQIIEGERQRVFEKMAHGDNLDSILEQVGLYVEASKIGGSCCILLLDEAGKHLQTVAAPSFPESYLGELKPLLPNDESNRCCAWVASALHSERVILEDIGEHPCRVNCQAFIREIGAVACWSEPIFSSSGQLLGVLTLYINQGGAPGHNDLALLMQASHLSSIAIERKRIEQQMYRQASYDALTGLPNRRLFSNRLREEIAKAERGAYRVALLFIDLDRFKEVNDSLGHEAGDLLIVEAAQRIRARVRESDTVARLGGDEFIVILPEVGDIFPQDRVAQDLVEAMERPFRLGKHDVFVSASIGIAGYPQDADNAETLIGCADQAMYAAKDMGRNGFSFFTRSMQEQAQQRLQVAAELRGALGKGQLEVYYQPIIEVASGRVVKAEALLRWRHPELGMVSPDKFIPIAEETGLIQEIGAWVFGEAANTAKRWNALCKSGDIRQVSVNMSPRQFVRGNPDTVCIEYLQAIDLNPKAMVIEITEGLLLDDQAEVMNKLRRFHEAGIQLALDDFGTGYSAMGYLKKFNIDYLKIDRSFIRDIESDPGDRTITEAIVVMAHRLGLKVIAEGVETEGQRELLAAVRCEYVQGYLYARPMPLEAFLDYAAGNAVSAS